MKAACDLLPKSPTTKSKTKNNGLGGEVITHASRPEGLPSTLQVTIAATVPIGRGPGVPSPCISFRTAPSRSQQLPHAPRRFLQLSGESHGPRAAVLLDLHSLRQCRAHLRRIVAPPQESSKVLSGPTALTPALDQCAPQHLHHQASRLFPKESSSQELHPHISVDIASVWDDR